MTDPNIFDELMKLLNQPGPVNWALAGQIATHMTGAREPIDPWVAEEYIELTRLAQLRIAEATGLDTGPIVATIPLDRSEWAERNLRSYRYIVEPLAQKMADAPAAGGLDAILKPLGPALLGMQMGVMVGLLSQSVLGQFDVGVPTAETGDLYYVVPNIEAFIDEHHLDARQVRLWVALHEVTHQAQFARPWVRPHFQGLIEAYIAAIEIDMSAFGEQMQGFNDPERLQEMMVEGGGFTGLLSGPEQKARIDEVQAFMAIVEGYGDHMMDRAASDLLPDLERMRGAIEERRSAASDDEGLLNRLLGMDLKREQYRLGAAFSGEVADRWGEDALARVWHDATHLPTLSELADPTGWAARVLLEDPFND